MVYATDYSESENKKNKLTKKEKNHIIKLEENLEKQIKVIIKKSKQPFFWETYLDVISSTKWFFTELSHGDYNPPDTLIHKLADLLNKLEFKNEFFEFAYEINGCEDSLYRHTVNVSILAYIVSQSRTVLEKPFIIAQMGLFHDIGKVALDPAILNKPEPLSKEERIHIQNHTILGEKIIKKLNINTKEILDSVLLHHESRDGSGYPFGLTSEKISIPVQIITLVDVFDSICSDRIYKKKKSVFIALNEIFIESTHNKFNPLLAFSFIEETMQHFLNKPVVLSSGESGILYHINPNHLIHPIIQISTDRFLDMSKNKNTLLIELKKEEQL